MRNCCMDAWSIRNEALAAYTARKQKRPNIFERFAHREFLKAGWSIEQMLAETIQDVYAEALGEASKMLQVSNSVKPELESLLEDLRHYRSLTEYHSIKRLIQNEAAVFSQVLEVIAEAFGAPCSWEGVTELMESRPGGWCGQNCGNMAHSACWGKFLEQKMMQKRRAGKYCHKETEELYE